MLLALLRFFTFLLTFFDTLKSNVYTYKQVDNLNLQAIVYTPTFSSKHLSPVLFTIHGGAFILGSKDAGSGYSLSHREVKELCSRGWTVVSIDYRLSPAVFLDEIFQDVQDAYAWVRKELPKIHPIDPDLIVVFGASSGGGLALMSGYKFNPRPKAIIAFYPYCSDFTDGYAYNADIPPSNDLIAVTKQLKGEKIADFSKFYANDPRGIILFDRIFGEQKGGWVFVSQDPEESPESINEKLRKFSAVEHVDENFPPTFLSHGLSDPIVPVQQSTKMAEKLKEKKIEYVLDLVPDAEHIYDLLYHREEVWKKNILPAFEFAEKFVKNDQINNG